MSKKKLIGVCGTNLFEQNSIQFLSSLKDASLRSGYTTIAFSTCTNSMEGVDDLLSEKQLLHLCRHIDLDCLVMLSETIKNTELINYIVNIGKEKNIPVFSIDRKIDGCYNMPLDYNSGFRNIVSHVINDHGVTKVNMLAGMKDNSFSEERVDIYKEALADAGIPFEPKRLEYGDFWDRPARIALEKFWNSGLEMPQAIICANDAMAITACSFLSARGIRIPEDIIITGFDGTEFAKNHYPVITTCTPDYDEAIEFIMEQTALYKETGYVNICDHMIGFKILNSQSCGCETAAVHYNNNLVPSLYDDVGDSSWHTIAMNSLVTNLLEKDSIEDIVHLLPTTVHLWSDHFRFACIRSELATKGVNLKKLKNSNAHFENMTTILCANNHIFDEDMRQFNAAEFVPGFNELIKAPGTTFVARILKNGRYAYGYTVDEFNTLRHRQLQSCNEFAMFLTHSINTVLHNYELNELNHNLEKAYDEIALLSVHDPMTGLLNRRGFFNKLNALLEKENYNGKYLYIVNVDLDKLKYINDNFGHKEGDYAINSIAHALEKLDTDNLICARFGGDEFTCAFINDDPDVCEKKEAKSRIKAVLDATPEINKKPYPVDFSIGISYGIINQDINIESLISSADAKMYADKATKKRRSTDH